MSDTFPLDPNLITHIVGVVGRDAPKPEMDPGVYVVGAWHSANPGMLDAVNGSSAAADLKVVYYQSPDFDHRTGEPNSPDAVVAPLEKLSIPRGFNKIFQVGTLNIEPRHVTLITVYKAREGQMMLLRGSISPGR